jgi:hypothetical protein
LFCFCLGFLLEYVSIVTSYSGDCFYQLNKFLKHKSHLSENMPANDTVTEEPQAEENESAELQEQAAE